jgi:hypothetical protein
VVENQGSEMTKASLLQARQLSLPHGWQEETPELLTKAWFADDCAGLIELVRLTGQEAGIVADLAFLHSTLPNEFPPETIAMFTVNDVQVPYFLRLDLKWQDEIRLHDLKDILSKRLREIISGYDQLRRRFGAMDQAARTAIESIGHGARLRQLVLEPQNLETGAPNLRQRRFRIEIDLLGDDLKPAPFDYMAGQPAELTQVLKLFANQQKARAAAIERRALCPGEIEGEKIALHLLRLANVAPEEVARLEPRYCVNGPSPLLVEGAELTDLQFFLAGGRISARFDFEGGYYHSGWLILHDTLPELVQESLVGKPVNEVISGGIFDVINPKIVSRGEMSRGTKLTLELLLEWTSLPSSP